MKRGILLVAVIMAAIFAGCNNYHLAKGDEHYQKLQYQAAIENYRKYLRSNEDPQVRLRLAESCMKINKFHEAFEELGKVRRQNDPQNYWLFKGRSFMEAGRYDSAEVAFKNYLNKNPKDFIADELCKTCTWAYSQMNDTGYFEVRPIMIKGLTNYFSATHYKNGVIFTASRLKAEKSGTEKDFNLYYLEKDSTGEYKEPVMLDGDVNGDYNETCPCLNPDDGQLVFARSSKKNLKEVNLQSNLKILFANYKEGGWKDIREFPYNDQRYSVGHPSVSGKNQLFFFVSDKPGGNGGSDIYYSIMTGGGFSEPQNLGSAVNTAFNEMFPWYNETDSCLYFSSEGHQNFGGLDIFRVKFIDGKPGVVQNLGFPVNSSKDDFSYLLEKGGKSGYFSSNRSGNDRLYEVRVLNPKVVLKGMITEPDFDPLADVNVNIIDQESGNKKTVVTNAQGIYECELELEKTYIIEALKPNYFLEDPIQVSTAGITKHKTILADFKLSAIELDKAMILDQLYYDINSWEVSDESKNEMNKLVEILKNNPNVTVEIGSHTDSRADDVFNLKLSAKRARSVVDFMISQGVSEHQLIWKGFGETRLLNRCENGVECSESDHALNRRTEFKVVKIDDQISADK